jgi:N-acetylglucosamine-6-phosphate deacetylase
MKNGYIDLQVNGFRGIDFSYPGLTLDEIRTVSRLLGEKGVEAYCPTLISSPFETYEHNLPLIAAAMREESRGARILGIHLEGPFLNAESGPRGIHQAEYIKPPSMDLYEQLRDMSNDGIAIITIAPDQRGAAEIIHRISSETRTIVSLGHHLANDEQIDAAVDAGARAATHVGNGLPSMIHRHLNPLWKLLSDDRLYAFLIADGFHLPLPFLKVALRSKPPDKIIITSDLMRFGGMPAGSYMIGEQPIVLEENGKLHQKGSTQLAGAALPIDGCVKYLQDTLALSPEIIRRITRINPMDLLQINI